ncbi:MAG: haloacid dehalogenase-like hydrolase [Candidatus Woesebacteria bacterium]|jgi:phosphoserine phosphatase
MNTNKPIAVFDIDGTFFRSSLFLESVMELDAMGAIPHEIITEIEPHKLAWQQREDQEAFNTYMRMLCSAFDNKYITQILLKDYLEALKRAVQNKQKYVYTYTRELAKNLRQQGYTPVAISGSPQVAVEQFAKPYGFEVFRGMIFGDDGQNLTEVLHIPDKDKSIDLTDILKKHRLTLAGSVGIGDTAGDIPVLNMVERPIAFNPNKQLFEHAKQKGWEIVVERKNMHYQLSPGKAGSYQLTF